jgi:high-affinity nickel-transport protein
MLSGFLPIPVLILSIGIGGTVGVLGAALALGIRHGIDWDHIAAITDITSTAASLDEAESGWLVREPALMLTDESHHSLGATGGARTLQAAVAVGGAHSHSMGELAHRHNGHGANGQRPAIEAFVRKQKPALVLGSMYALGHGSIVIVLGMLALLVRQFLPAWIDPIMERIVGVTLIFLAVYLLYSVYQYFRGGHEFRLRSRWMLVFAGLRNATSLVQERVFGRPREHVHEAQQYGIKTAYAVGLVHGVGAETGTQVLVIATAVGAGSRGMGVAALGAFVVGLLISNSIVTIISTAGFVSSQRRQWIYVAAGLLAAIFSLFVGLFFVFHRANVLPDLGGYFRWIGGPG